MKGGFSKKDQPFSLEMGNMHHAYTGATTGTIWVGVTCYNDMSAYHKNNIYDSASRLF
jgi:hypothetical protein